MRDISKTLNNLAAVLHQLRKFDEAMAVYQRALEIKKRSDGEEHFSVGHTLYNVRRWRCSFFSFFVLL